MSENPIDNHLDTVFPPPKVIIGAEFLENVERFNDPDVSFERSADGSMIGGILRLKYEGTNYVYRIVEEKFAECCYVAEWPD